MLCNQEKNSYSIQVQHTHYNHPNLMRILSNNTEDLTISEDEHYIDHDFDHPNAKSELYKTELCRSFMETGRCRYAQKCQFAHGTPELRPVKRHPKYKTKVCRNFMETGTCRYGSRCRFIHCDTNGKFHEMTSSNLVSLDEQNNNQGQKKVGRLRIFQDLEG